MTRQAMARSGQWRRLPLIRDPRLRWGLALGGLVYLLLALSTIDVNWARVAEGAGRGLNFLAAFTQPDFVSRRGDILDG
ncbi:MAG: phosphonate ABC transporter, permease protein PhnE, partial [Halomonas campaniensis]